MLDHLALQVADVDATAAFYLEVFAALDVRELMRFPRPEGTVVGLGGPDGFPHLWFGPLVDPGLRPVHLALTAASREAVDAVQAAAGRAGASCIRPGVARVPPRLLRRVLPRPGRQQRRGGPPQLVS